MWLITLVSVLSAHEGHDHDGTGGVALTMLPELLCEAQWPNMAEAPEGVSRRCNSYFLPFAYPDGFRPEQPPTHGDPIELRLSITGLQQILVHLEDTCHVDEPVEDAGCFRAGEFYQGVLDRKMSVNDNGAWFDLLLEKILAGEPLAEADLRRQWSEMTLLKLANAVYARHGKDFDNPDLDAFFYGPREQLVAGLPLTKTAPATISLTEVDQRNLTRIEAARNRPEAKKSYGL